MAEVSHMNALKKIWTTKVLCFYSTIPCTSKSQYLFMVENQFVSLIIVEYIDQTWPQNPLFPNDPYERAIARFWVKFADDMASVIGSLFKTSGEEQEKAIKDSLEMLKILEEQGLGDKTFFGGDKIGIEDIAFGAFAHWLGVIEEKIGLQLLQANAFPRFHAWTKNFKEVPCNQREPS